MASANDRAGIVVPLDNRRAVTSLGIPVHVLISLHRIAEGMGLTLSALHRQAILDFVSTAELPPDLQADALVFQNYAAGIKPKAKARYYLGLQQSAGGSTD
jgi:hypothetical protein